jgi:hypothetical protein
LFLDDSCPPKVNSASVAALSISEVLVLLKTPERPITLSFVLPAPKLKPSDPAPTSAAAPRASSSGPASPAAAGGLRTLVVRFASASLGLKIKPAASVPELVQVTGFARAADGSVLPAEASGEVEVGMLLLRVNDLPLWGLGFAAVAQALKQAAAAAAAGGPGAAPLALLLGAAADAAVHFEGTPTDLMLARVAFGEPSAATGGAFGVVVTGFESAPGPVEASGLVLPGDTLVAASGVGCFPGPRGYRADVASLKDAK